MVSKVAIEKENKSISKFATFDTSHQIINESSEIAEVIKELNTDTLDTDNFSSIDTKTRLNNIDIRAMTIVDGLIAMNFLPKEVSKITRSKKRLSVSLGGLGRKEIVEIAKGELERQNGGFGNKLKDLFSNQR